MNIWRKCAAALAIVFCLTQAAQAGALVKEKIDLDNLPEWKMRSADAGGTLLFSDSPEIVKQDGILYSDVVRGSARLLYYHLNGTKQPKKIVAVLENSGREDVNVTITNYGMGGPSSDYLYVGRTTQQQYFRGGNVAFAHVPARGKRLLLQKMNDIVVEPEKLVYGVVDFDAPAPVRVTVLMLPVTEDPLQFVSKAKVLPADASHLRGTFAGMDRVLKSDKIYDGKEHGPVAVTLADGVLDRYRTGIDATDGSIVENYGNYGVLYHIHIPTKGGGSTKYYLNPRGGVYSGAMTMRLGAHASGKLLSTPRDRAFFGEDAKTDDITYLGEESNFRSVWFEFSPPGASNLPARLILVPGK